MRKIAVIIHGWGGHPEEGWRPWLREQLQERGYEVHIPAMPDTDHPKPKKWEAALAQEIGEPDEGTLLIGHSLGCPTILRYLEGLLESQRVGSVILIAGCARKLGEGFEELEPFFERPFDWDTIIKHCDRFAVLHSEDDPLVPVAFAREMADRLDSKPIVVENRRHFASGDGIEEIYEVLAILEGFGE